MHVVGCPGVGADTKPRAGPEPGRERAAPEQRGCSCRDRVCASSAYSRALRHAMHAAMQLTVAAHVSSEPPVVAWKACILVADICCGVQTTQSSGYQISAWTHCSNEEGCHVLERKFFFGQAEAALKDASALADRNRSMAAELAVKLQDETAASHRFAQVTAACSACSSSCHQLPASRALRVTMFH